MKPTRNRVYCAAASRSKMLFETRKKADAFLTYNVPEMAEDHDVVPTRSYYCPSCGGWHVTHVNSVEYYKAMDEKNDTAHALTRLIEDLKTRFDVKKVGYWKKRLEEGLVWKAMLEGYPDQHMLMVNAEKYLSHFGRLIEKQERKELKETDPSLGTELHEIRLSVDKCLASLDIEGCLSLLPALEGLCERPAYSSLSQRKQDAHRNLLECFRPGAKLHILKYLVHIMKRFTSVERPDHELITVTSFNLSKTLDEALTAGISRDILNPFLIWKDKLENPRYRRSLTHTE